MCVCVCVYVCVCATLHIAYLSYFRCNPSISSVCVCVCLCVCVCVCISPSRGSVYYRCILIISWVKHFDDVFITPIPVPAPSCFYAITTHQFAVLLCITL